ncbi:MAG TPA: Gfo/Idh/MocA family oxidoreductase [Abditibacteriaceae bacterium]|jgi:predicted dehydrogenase
MAKPKKIAVPTEPTRIGIIGLGGMGRHHASYLGKGEVPGAVLAAVCDVSPEALQTAVTAQGVPGFASAEEMYRSGTVDAVIIATPHYDHPPLAISAFKHNLHALVEKPAGVYTKQVKELNEAAAQTDRVFGIMFNQRTRGFHQKMKDLVSSGELGEITRTNYVITDWFRSQFYYDSGGWRATWAGEGGGVLMNQCPHNLDLWQWICGMPVRVRAFCKFGRYHDIEVEDDVTAYVEYENGASGVFISSTGEAPGTNCFEIIGDRGKLKLEDNTLTFWRTEVSVSEHLRTVQNGFERPATWKCDVPAWGGEDHIGITKDWVKSIRTGSPLLARGEEGINGVTLCNAMLLSAWTDKWVDLPFDDNLYHRKLKERIKNSQNVKDAKKSKTMEVAGTF